MKKSNTDDFQRFSVHATKPNLIIDMGRDEEEGNHQGNPEWLVKSFSQLSIKEGYHMRTYREDGLSPSVWAIPADKALLKLSDAPLSENDFLYIEKPDFTLDNFMEAIDGDKSPLSYLQAAIVFHELNEYGAVGHNMSWRRDIILPYLGALSHEYEWEILENEPERIEPYFYYNAEGHPVIVFFTINDVYTITLNRYEHIFSHDNYTLTVNRHCIATAGYGILP